MKEYIAPRIKKVTIPQSSLLAGSDTIEFTNQRGDNKREVLSKHSNGFYDDSEEWDD